MPSEWVDLVLVDASPPIPFDDASVLQVMRDHLSWFVPLLGSRLRGHKIFSHAASRCAGAATSFSAGSKVEAEWVAEQNPWRRLGGGACFPVPEGLFTIDNADAGPSVQRSR